MKAGHTPQNMENSIFQSVGVLSDKVRVITSGCFILPIRKLKKESRLHVNNIMGHRALLLVQVAPGPAGKTSVD